MAAQPWKLYSAAKKKIGTGTMALGVGTFKMSLHRNSASGTIRFLSSISIWSSVGSEISAVGGYAAGGRAISPAAGTWTAGTSILQMKFTYQSAGLIFTASGANLTNIRYALIRKSAAALSGHVLCYCSLSSAAFTITTPNTLTILPAGTGVFTLA